VCDPLRGRVLGVLLAGGQNLFLSMDYCMICEFIKLNCNLFTFFNKEVLIRGSNMGILISNIRIQIKGF